MCDFIKVFFLTFVRSLCRLFLAWIIEACEPEQLNVLQEGLTSDLITTTGHTAEVVTDQYPELKSHKHAFQKNQFNKSEKGR